MWQYLVNIWESLKTPLIGMRLTWKRLFVPAVTLQYPEERWELPPEFPYAAVCEHGRLYRLYTVRTGLPGAVHHHRDDQGRA